MEDDWMNTDINVPASKFEDEDKPEEKKEVKVAYLFINRKKHLKNLNLIRRRKSINWLLKDKENFFSLMLSLRPLKINTKTFLKKNA
jgi:hypothetical protein